MDETQHMKPGPAHANPGAAMPVLDAEAFRAVERLAAYEIANAMLDTQLALQRRLGLRAEECQVFLAIAVATVQRFARVAQPHSEHVTRAPLPENLSGHISRRRIAESLGLPLETVRRHAARLIDRGLVIEKARGQLSTRGGTLQHLSGDETPFRIAGQFVGVVRSFARLGALTTRQSD